jgi:ribosomal protein S15P/S13E
LLRPAALEQAADVAGSATEQVNLALGEINALARHADEAGEPHDARRALAEIDRQIEGLSAALSATGAALGSPSRGTG